jgi:3-hydroxyacyl-[acyl-carrier-protein] dehydratase
LAIIFGDAMRFYFFDRVINFVPGKEATGIKNLSSQEEFLIDHYDRFPVMPAPLIVESITQLGGWAVTVSSDYKYLAIMVMVRDLEVSGEAIPGDQIVLNVRIENLNEYGASISGDAKVNGNSILKIGSLTYVLYEIPEEDRKKVRERHTRLLSDTVS